MAAMPAPKEAVSHLDSKHDPRVLKKAVQVFLLVAPLLIAILTLLDSRQMQREAREVVVDQSVADALDLLKFDATTLLSNRSFDAPKPAALQAALEKLDAALALEDGDWQVHRARGVYFEAVDNETKAEAAYRAAIRTGPKVAAAHVGLANFLADTDADEARQHFLRALDLEPASAVVHAHVGDFLTDQKDFETAIDHLQRAVELDPTSALAPLLLARAMIESGDDDGAIEHLQAAMELDSDSASILFLHGEQSLKAGRDQSALLSLARASEAAPHAAFVQLLIGIVQYDSGRKVESLTSFRKAIDLEPHSYHTHFFLAAVLFDLGRLEEAEGPLARAAALDPQSPYALSLSAAIAAFRTSSADALRQIEIAREWDPTNHFAALIHANLLLDAGWRQQAIDLLVEHSRLATVPREIRETGSTLLDWGEVESATEVARRMIEIAPDDGGGHYLLARAMLEDGQRDAAIEELRTAIRRDPEFEKSYAALGRALIAQGEVDEGLDAYRRVTVVAPNNGWTFMNYGLALLRKDRVAEGLAACREAVRIEPWNSELHVELGLALIDHGNALGGLNMLWKAIELDPANGWRYLTLGQELIDQQLLENGLQVSVRASEIAPHDWELSEALARRLTRYHRFDEALDVLRAAIVRYPAYVPLQRQLATTLFDIERVDEGLAVSRRAHEKLPQDAYIGAFYCDKLLRYDSAERGLALFEKIMDELPAGHPSVYSDLGYRLLERKFYPQSLRAYRRAIDLGRDDAEGFVDLAWALVESGDLDSGLAMYRQAVQVGASKLEDGVPDYVGDIIDQLLGERAHYPTVDALLDDLGFDVEGSAMTQLYAKAGRSLANERRWQPAEVNIRRAAELDPAQAVPLYSYLGEMFYYSGQPDRAAAMYRRALRGESKNLEDYWDLGEGFRRLDLFSESVVAFRRVVDLGPDPDGRYAAKLGDALLRAGQPEEALESFQVALDLAPRNASFRIQLASALVASGQREAGLQRLLQIADEYPSDHSVLWEVGDALEEAGLAGEASQLVAKGLEVLREPGSKRRGIQPASSEVREFLAQHRERLGLPAAAVESQATTLN